MIPILLKIIDSIIQIKKDHSQKLHKQFAHIVEPIFSDLEKVHSDYLRMFTNASLRLQQNPEALVEVIQTLEVQRLEFEPIRIKLQAALSEFNIGLPSFMSPTRLESEIDRFLYTVLLYLPIGDIASRGGGTGSSTLIASLKKLNSTDKSKLTSISFFPEFLYNLFSEVELTDIPAVRHPLFSSTNKSLPWGNDPIQCVEFYINMQRQQWKIICEALAAAKVEITKRS